MSALGRVLRRWSILIISFVVPVLSNPLTPSGSTLPPVPNKFRQPCQFLQENDLSLLPPSVSLSGVLGDLPNPEINCSTDRHLLQDFSNSETCMHVLAPPVALPSVNKKFTTNDFSYQSEAVDSNPGKSIQVFSLCQVLCYLPQPCSILPAPFPSKKAPEGYG